MKWKSNYLLIHDEIVARWLAAPAISHFPIIFEIPEEFKLYLFQISNHLHNN